MELDHGYYCSQKHSRVPNPSREWRKEYSQAYCSGMPVAAAQPQSSALLWGQNILSKCEEESYSTQSRSKCFPFMQPASEELKQQPNGLDRRFSHDLRHSIDGFSTNSTISESHPSSSCRLQDDRRKQLLNLGLDEFGDITSLHKGSTLENAPIRLARNLGFTTMNRLPEKLLLGSVPWRLRAKRGCATHPRSIAERVRRTRISDRIRKLQKLVPNTDKQTNTAEMLDETIHYVKQLQRQVQELSEHESECRGLCRGLCRGNVMT